MNKKYLIPIFALMMLFLCSAAFADENNLTSITITAPAASGWLYGSTYTMTASYIGNSTGNITFYYNLTIAPGTELCADTTITTVNSTASCSANTTKFADECTGHTIYARYYEVSAGNNLINGTQTTVKFDNTAPVITSFTADYNASTMKRSKPNEYRTSVTDACGGTLQYSVNLTKPDASVVTKATTTSSGGMFSGTDNDQIGSYTATVGVSDPASQSSTSAKILFDVKGDTDAYAQAVGVQQVANVEKASTANNVALYALMFLVIILIISIALFLVISDK